jgi:thymidine phosphorylase
MTSSDAITAMTAELATVLPKVGPIDSVSGRARETDSIDHAVGLTEVAAPGERVGAGERPLAIVHARDAASARRAVSALNAACVVGDRAPEPPPPVLEVIR